MSHTHHANEVRHDTWLDAARRSPLWDVLARTDNEGGTAFQHLAAHLVSEAFNTWGLARRTLVDNGFELRVWCDERYSMRVLERTSALLALDQCGPEEVLLVLFAPFLREAVHAAGFAWIASAAPLDLESRAAAAEPRNAVQQVHRSKPHLVRRAQGLEGDARTAVCLWMAELALARVPRLRRRGESIEPVEALFRAVEHLLAAEHSPREHAIFRALLRLSRAIGADPDALDAEGGVGRDCEIMLEKGRCVRVPALAHLLCVAGAQALDPRAVDEVAIDHIGRDSVFSAKMLLDTLHAATWTIQGERHVLAYTCTHPVLDFVLRDLVERADFALERARAKRDEARSNVFSLLERLPKRLVADDVQPASAEYVPAYTLPHVRFRLDQERIRELLMGEALYGDPSVAVRELYQNALDACRYRTARVTCLGHERETYAGRIVFRQATDAQGRLYIECEDNGVGMTKEVLERVFAVAGRRFHDMPDFLEERARWQAHEPPIEFYPNSQFGIGVLSYFMLADEVSVWTRRYEADGRLGSPIAVQISSVSGLFRVQHVHENAWHNEALPDAGTRVRLYLRAATYESERDRETPTSCMSILKTMLWIAEVDTSVEEDGERFAWIPGKLVCHEVFVMPHVREISLKIRPTNDPDIVWSPEGRLLCDGLYTETPHDCVIANLRGKRLPEMSVDRKKVRTHDEVWIEQMMGESWQHLVDWEDLTIDTLWALEQASPRSARLLVEALPPDTRVSRRYDRGRVPLRVVGCFSGDYDALMYMHRGKNYAEYSFLQAFRISAWAAAGAVELPRSWPESSLLDGTRAIVAMPGDTLLLNSTRWIWEMPREVSPLRAMYVARSLDVSPSRVLRRIEELAPLGPLPPTIRGEDLDQRAMTADDWRILTARTAFNGVDFGEWSVDEIIDVSRKLYLPPAELLDRIDSFADLGVERPRWIRTEVLSAMGKRALTDDDCAILSAVRKNGKVSLAALLGIASRRKTSPRQAFERLEALTPLGVALPPIEPRAFDIVEKGDEAILGCYEHAIAPWLGRELPRWHLLHMRVMCEEHEKKMTPSDLLRRVEALSGLGVKLPFGAAEILGTVEVSDEERALVKAALWRPAFQVVEVAQEMGSPLGPILGIAARLGMVGGAFAHTYTTKHGDYVPDEHDTKLVGGEPHRSSAGAAATMVRFRDDARYRLWYLADAAFNQRFERLRPLIAQDIDKGR